MSEYTIKFRPLKDDSRPVYFLVLRPKLDCPNPDENGVKRVMKRCLRPERFECLDFGQVMATQADPSNAAEATGAPLAGSVEGGGNE